jgi:Helix-turn-helix domain
MSAKRINSRLIKLHRSYSVDEVARTLGVHKNTVRGWIKDGLPAFTEKRPTVILGQDLRAFLESKQKAAKCPSGPGRFHCFKCRQPMRPALGMVEYRPRNDVTGNLKAMCESCGGWMHRAARLASIPAIMPNIDVQIVEAEARIRERTNPSLNCDNQED